jgi:ABC-type branched-subunit amino acid transport system permease subunit
VGAAVYVVVQDRAAQLNPFHWMLLLGALLIATVLFLEAGLTSLPRSFWNWLFPNPLRRKDEPW